MNTTTLRTQQEVLADNAFASYKFGDDAIVVGFEKWSVDTFDGKDDWTKVVYLKFDDQGDMEPSIKVSFHAAFAAGTLVLNEAYAYDFETGTELGATDA